jgi:anti-sigma factor RsiW
MNDNREIEELLNAFIDGESSPREQTEVKRLIDNDPQAAERLKELQKCKSLLSSLPHQQAPSKILTNVMAKISADKSASGEPAAGRERGGQETFRSKRQALGVIQLFIRKTLTAAAMFILIFGLILVIYQIVSPQKTQHIARTTPAAKGVLENRTAVKETVAVKADKAAPPSNVSAGSPVPAVAGVLTARLELKTKTQDARLAIQKLLEEKLAPDFVVLPSEDEKTVYTLNCSGEKIAAVQADLENLWNEFASAVLLVETDKPGRLIVIDKITASQVADIASQQNLERQLKAASYFSIVNNIRQSRFAADTTSSKPNDIPRPLLAKDEQAKPSPGQAALIHLTIEIGSE